MTFQQPKLFLHQVDEIIKQNLSDPDLIEILVRKFHLSYSQIYRKIKQKSGYTPSTYIRKQRLSIARLKLRNTDRPITEIAFQSGFQNTSYFSKSFLEEYGLSPSQFRKQHEVNHYKN
jgi:AraC-like DNA-binding protein